MRCSALAMLAWAGSARSFSVYVLHSATLIQHSATWRHRASRRPCCRSFTHSTVCMGRQREGDVADANDNKKKKPTKSNLPSKVCATCGRPFEWRKKWAAVWEDVKYCSDRCRNSRSKGSPDSAPSTADTVTRSFSSSATRRQWAQAAATVAASSAVLALQPRAAAAKPAPPTAAEVAAVLSSIEWDDDDTPFTADDFRRLDSSPDSAFYDSPKMVEHIDAPAQAAMQRFYTKFLADVAQIQDQQQQPNVLDLCASWVSHLPASYSGDTAGPRVAGLGMNAAELKLNK
jgi:hypothetical protein